MNDNPLRFPPDLYAQLILAGRAADVRLIDAITDELARRGFVRPRHDDQTAVKPWKTLQ